MTTAAALQWAEEMKTRDDPAPLYPLPLKPGVTPYAHQIKAFNLGIALEGFAALLEMGCGKSLVAVAVTGWRFLTGRVRRVLIVAPTSVCAVWPGEYAKFAAFPHRVALLLGDKGKRVRALKELQEPGPECLRVAVINYESAWRLSTELQDFAPDMIVCDESQRIKNPAARQSKALHQMGDRARYRMILTGTPIQKNPLDLWSQYRFLAPEVFGRNYYQFRSRYAVMGGPHHQMVLLYRNLEELTRKAHSIALRVTKEECLDLPEQIFETRAVPLPEKAAQLYKRIKRDSVAILTAGTMTAPIVLTRLLRLQQLTGGFLQLDGQDAPALAHTAKLDALEDILEDHVLSAGHKLVIFARFVPEVRAIQTLLERRGFKGERSEPRGEDRPQASADPKPAGAGGGPYKYVAIWGEVPLTKRGAIVDQFQGDPETMVFLAQLDTAGEGITLTGSFTTVYYSVNFNWAKYSQSLARTHRIGQRHVCTYIHLTAPGTIDEDIMRALEQKADLARLVVDNWREYFTKEN